MIEIKSTKKISVAFKEGTGLGNFDKEESSLKSALEENNTKSKGPTIGIFYGDPRKIDAEKPETIESLT